MKKQKLAVLLAGAAILATAGIASADGTINMYGSSAQAKFWNGQAGAWLSSMGCTGITTSSSYAISETSSASNAGNTNYQVYGSGCTNADATALAGSGKLIVNYTANDSVTGIQSVSGTGGDPDSCGSAFQRLMYGTSSSSVCQTVHVGVSDVKASSITQASKGHKLGPFGGTVLNRNFVGGVPATGLTAVNPGGNGTLVTPFGFFVNGTAGVSSVTATQCTAGLVGSYCAAPSDPNFPGDAILSTDNATANQKSANAQCDTSNNKGDGVCGATAAPVTNISHLQAVLLFSGQIQDWSNFGSSFTAQPVALCLRHAGSGTHATLDLAVMRSGGTGWGANLVNAEAATGSPVVWFNFSSSDEYACINSIPGAIGYADADALPQSSYPNIARLAYNGVYPTRTAIRNGLYDFYATAWFYTLPANGALVNNLVTDMITWAQDPNNIWSSKANYWNTVQEMQFWKTTDQAFPSAVNANWPLLP